MENLHPMLLAFSGIVWIIMGLIGGRLAEKRGRNPWFWCFVGVMFWPALLALLVLPDLNDELEEPTGRMAREVHAAFDEATTVLADDYFSSHVWYYLDESHKEEGPVEFSFIRDLWTRKQLTEASYLWHEGMADWKPLGKVPGIREALASTR